MCAKVNTFRRSGPPPSGSEWKGKPREAAGLHVNNNQVNNVNVLTGSSRAHSSRNGVTGGAAEQSQARPRECANGALSQREERCSPSLPPYLPSPGEVGRRGGASCPDHGAGQRGRRRKADPDTRRGTWPRPPGTRAQAR